jgi:predicted nucleic acid-binding protein
MATVIIDSSLFITAFRERKDAQLTSFLTSDKHDIGTCDIVRVEIKSGILGTKNEETRRKQELWYRQMFEAIPSRPLDWQLCETAADLAGRARRNGYQASIDDAFIAATACEVNGSVATANLSHFQQLGVEAFNPLENPPAQLRA